MLYKTDLDLDQVDAIDRLYECDETLLIAPTGGGKTIIALTAISELIRDRVLKRVLVLAPLKVAENVWRGEHKLWYQTQHLKVGIATGDAFGSVLSHITEFDIVVVNFDMVPQLVQSGAMGQFDGLAVDEGTKMARGGVWFKRLRKHVKDFNWRAVMSATPITEGWERLFYQTFLVDGGVTFGRNKEKWLREYFYPTDFQQRNWAVIPTMDAKLAAAVEHLVYVMPDYKHKLPPFRVEIVPAPLPPIGKKHYNEMAGGFETAKVLARTAAARVGKLQQVAAGFIYDDDKKAIHIHDAKYKVLDQLLTTKLLTNRCLLIYQYTEQLERLNALYPDLVTLDDGPDVIARWNRGEIDKLAIHPLSAGRGLNMAQGGCNLIWLTPFWSLDLFSQTNERLWRRGQSQPVTAWVICAPDTVDDLVMLRHKDKALFMPALLDHLKTASQNAA